jgi:uncharacterized membrane protein HdeD (DUF308 family)
MSGTEYSVYEQDALITTITESWQVGLGAGLIMLALGLVVAFHPTTSLNVLAVLIGIIAIVSGLFGLIRSLNPGEPHRALSAIVGLIMIVVGVVLIRHLDLTRVLVALLVGVIFIVNGVADLMLGFSGASRSGRVWPILIGLVSLAAGIVLLAAPENSVTFLATLVGIWWAVLGGLEVIASLVLRHRLNRAVAGSHL